MYCKPWQYGPNTQSRDPESQHPPKALLADHAQAAHAGAELAVGRKAAPAEAQILQARELGQCHQHSRRDVQAVPVVPQGPTPLPRNLQAVPAAWRGEVGAEYQ